MKAIYKRELNSYFHTMIGYVFIAFLVAYTGIYFMAYNLNYGYPYFSYVLSGVLFVLLIAVPVLTMRSFAEERKNKTDQLLLTSPVSVGRIVLGKYLAMVTILAVPCVIYLIFPLIIKAQGTAYILTDYLSILMFFLLGCVYISIGLLLSSLTESTIIAAISTVGILVALYLWSGILEFLPAGAGGNAVGIVLILSLLVLGLWQMTKNWLFSAAAEVLAAAGTLSVYLIKPELFENLLSEILGKLELTEYLTSITQNSYLDLGGIILYLSLIVIFLFLTVQMIQKRRWS